MGACTPEPPWVDPLCLDNHPAGASRARLSFALPPVEGIRNNHVSTQRTKRHNGKQSTLKDVKNEGRVRRDKPAESRG
jgi:hypothetical protein